MDETAIPQPFRLKLPDETETGPLPDDRIAMALAVYPEAKLITHVGDIAEARRAEEIYHTVQDLRKAARDAAEHYARTGQWPAIDGSSH
jgi:hypothetical protein